MFKRTQELVLSEAFADAILNCLDTVPGAALLAAAEVILFTAGPPLDKDMDAGDYTVATFTGYAVDTFTPILGPANFPGGRRGMHAQVDFVCTADIDPSENVIGYLLTNGDQSVTWAGEIFDEPVTFAEAGDTLSLDLIVSLPAILPGE